MKHTQHIVPIKTNRNKFNNSIPFRVIFSGTFNRNIYYDLSSAYLKMKIRCKPEQLKCIEKTSNPQDILTDYNDDFFIPTFNSTPVDYIGGFFSVYDDNGEELKFELNNINNEESENGKIDLVIIQHLWNFLKKVLLSLHIILIYENYLMARKVLI